MKIYEKILPNQLKIVMLPNNNVNTVAVGVFILTGSRNEYGDTPQGVSHFLEHMLYKGTTNRARDKLLSDIDLYTVNYNGVTTRQHTYYYFQGISSNIKHLINLIFDMVFNSTIKTMDINRERNVIMEEKNLINDDPISKLQFKIHKKLFSGTTLGNKIIGTRESLQSIKRKDLVDYKNRYYVPSNMVFVVSGNFNVDMTFSIINRSLSNVPDVNIDKYHELNNIEHDKEMVSIMNGFESQNMPRLFKKSNKNLGKAYIIIVFPLYDLYEKYYPEIQILSNMLSYGAGSIFNMALRENNGLSYNIDSYAIVYSKISIYAISCATNPKSVNLCIRNILQQLRTLKRDIIPSQQLSQVKKMIVNSSNVVKYDPVSTLINYGISFLYNPNYKSSNAEYINKIKNVKRNNIRELANKIFVKNKMNIFIHGNYETINEKLFVL